MWMRSSMATLLLSSCDSARRVVDVFLAEALVFAVLCEVENLKALEMVLL